MHDLIEVIANYFREWGDIPLLQAIFQTSDPATITQQVHDFCMAELGSPIEETLFCALSQGAVFGLRLRNGQRVVIKAHQPRRAIEYLSAMVHVQHYLADHGYPCPRPLLGPMPLVAGQAVVEELIDEGSYKDAHDPAIRRSMAGMLARLVDLTRQPESIPDLQPSTLDCRLPPDVLWPVPHNAIFDFEATAKGAEWIDDLARQAREVLAMGAEELVLGHTDWSINHLRYVGEEVRVIYDWDSLALNKEPAIVGDAARGFTYTEFLDVPALPTREEALAFVAEYEAARGKPFSADERKTLAAAATYGLAYGARCQHSLYPQERDYPADSSKGLLKHYGDAFLSC